jgi:hypothetical protein
MAKHSSDQIPNFIRELMPEGTEGDLLDAADNFRAYIAIVLRIHERVNAEKRYGDSSEPELRDRLDDANPEI